MINVLKYIKYKFFNIFDKSIVECKNKAGNTYYEVYINDESTGISWDSYDDAYFYYLHITKPPVANYIYKSIKEGLYYEIFMDNCTMYVVPKDEEHTEYTYDNITNDYRKYVMFLNYKRCRYICRKSLEEYYNDITSQVVWEKRVIVSSTNSDILEKAVDLTISNNDIKALQKIIKEYSDSVKLSHIIADKLISNLK